MIRTGFDGGGRCPASRAAALAAGVLGLALAVQPARADIYKFVDGNGVVHLADRALGPGYVLILRGRGKPSRPPPARVSRDYLVPLVNQVAQRYRIDQALVHAVITAESAYDPRAISSKGAVGLMQLMPDTARRYGVTDRRNPVQNVTGGVRYLRDLILRFRDVALALAAYNAGENAVTRHGNRVPPFPETQTYVRRVLTHWRRLRAAS